MRKPVARTIRQQTAPAGSVRGPRVFAAPEHGRAVDVFADEPFAAEDVPTASGRPNWILRILVGAGGLLFSLALGLAAEGLIRDLFSRYEWLGWVGIGLTVAFGAALLVLAIREVWSLMRLRHLDQLRLDAADVLISDKADKGRAVVGELQRLYAGRPDLARARTELEATLPDLFDGSAMVQAAERQLLSPLDARARTLTAAASRRVTVVTALSPRALVDIAFVGYESLRLARRIAILYGARPGFAGTWRLSAAVLGHLAVTGGVALGDSLVQQLIGHGLAAKLSARLGEGFINGLMTVRVGIAAMKVVRPLPFDVVNQPKVMDFVPDLAKVGARND